MEHNHYSLIPLKILFNTFLVPLKFLLTVDLTQKLEVFQNVERSQIKMLIVNNIGNIHGS